MNISNFTVIGFAPLFVAALAITLMGCSEDEEFGDEDFGTPVPVVEAIQVQEGTLPLVHRTTGEMRARNQVDIFPEINARVTEVLVNDGDRVEEGEPLVQLRDDDIREQLNQAEFDYQIADAQVRQAEAALRRLQAQFVRTQQLAEQDLESELELETIQADIDEAQASVDLARSQMERASSQVEEQRTNLENTVVRAPIDGVVGSRDAEVGQHVDSSTRLFQIGDIDNMRIFVPLTERMSSAIQPGSQAMLVTSPDDIENPGVEAVVVRISPFLDPITHSAIAELEVLENERVLRPGMFVSVDIVYGESEQAVLVPKTALYDHPIEGETGIYLADMETSQLEFDDVQVPEEQLEEEDELTATADPVDITFVPVQIIAESGGMAGVLGLNIENGWVVTVGQNQIAEWESEQAHIRTVDLEYILELQNLQTRDMESIIFGNNN
ncbi:MAG: efflux RND transporter periplasmic adaptor subunit [Balneolaceae bacterium]|nr:efflux RND transporter periplasmic adaptor subunit [Balneolaceae bacterium]